MIKVTIGTNTNRVTVLVPPSTKLRDLLEQNNVNYAATQLHIDGCPVQRGDMDKTLEELGLRETAYIIAVTKADNA